MQKTISIPKNLNHTKQIADQKAQDEIKYAKANVSKEVIEEIVEGRDLTQEIVDEVFSKVKEHFQKLGKSMELAILGQSMKMNKDSLTLEVMGNVQEELALKMKPELIRIIREIGNVNHFKIEVELKEELESERNKLYTSTDKFNFLKEKHAALGEFQRRFGLETDF
ncbi:hypothetical protein [Algoriphagus persicinus]|uniref:hypothetical protein n=1 Tax=Algoriphagus persicinus TaxID=3108754 RepID=UPI002B3C330D|nr:MULTISPECIES: hypothetical protein [unclassified Algoriphagus]MEB2782199.1 hypothetical protein [Algoriphagus sp. C2-6-M1]MEB2785489.1 hypothetical protein [Algoriphagus sp. E1-3-M2]